jgi:hypothetical protein
VSLLAAQPQDYARVARLAYYHLVRCVVRKHYLTSASQKRIEGGLIALARACEVRPEILNFYRKTFTVSAALAGVALACFYRKTAD